VNSLSTPWRRIDISNGVSSTALVPLLDIGGFGGSGLHPYCNNIFSEVKFEFKTAQ
jgi:hypothetical protein